MRESLKSTIRRAMTERQIAFGRYPRVESFDTHLRLLLDTCSIDTVVDVGANVGDYVTRLRRDIGYKHRAVSFEPTSAAFAELSRQASTDPLWHSHQLGLGAASDRLEITVYPKTLFNSLHAPTRHGRENFDLEGGTTEMIQVRRLDEVWSLLPRTEALMLKVDTQGHDMEVLRGAGDRLGDVSVIQIEAALIPLYSGSPTLPEVLSWLTDQGFAVTGMFPVGRDEYLRASEFDVFARKVG